MTCDSVGHKKNCNTPLQAKSAESKPAITDDNNTTLKNNIAIINKAIENYPSSKAERKNLADALSQAAKTATPEVSKALTDVIRQISTNHIIKPGPYEKEVMSRGIIALQDKLTGTDYVLELGTSLLKDTAAKGLNLIATLSGTLKNEFYHDIHVLANLDDHLNLPATDNSITNPTLGTRIFNLPDNIKNAGINHP